jgi:protease I
MRKFLPNRFLGISPAEVFTMRTRLIQSTAASCLAIFTMVLLAVPGNAAPTREDLQSDERSIAGDSLVHTKQNELDQKPDTRAQADRSWNGDINYGPQGQTDGPKPRLMNPGTVWPELTPPFPTMADERTAATFNQIAKVTGVNDPKFGAMPATAMGYAMTEAIATQLAVDYETDPQNAINRSKEEQNQANQTSADTNAQMERNQAGSAIDFCASYLYNFTVEAGNKWNRVRNELFLPMALLLLLPGVVLAQLKATVSAGTPVIADITSPFDGILRAIVGIFLIPGTYLFINYGIDVSNSITYTISHEYKRIFGSDMYRDAMCAHIRAFPYRNQKENKGFIPKQEADMNAPVDKKKSTPDTTFATFERQNLEVALRDPCAKLSEVPEDRANEMVPHVVNAQRNSYNTANSALAMTWNILCAFQMAYLYYLWFVGPIIAALWVYPMKELRDAFPAWINGVVTICFWSLFWNTTILLMACCRGVDETGTLIMSALNFLSTACVKFAFDFAGLVKEAGMQAAKMAEQGGAKGAGGGAGASGKQGAAGKDGGVPSYARHGENAVPPSPQTNSHGPVTAGGGGDNRTVASISPVNVSADGPGNGNRSLALNAGNGGAVGLDSFSYTPPPVEAGAMHARGLLGDHSLLNRTGSPLSLDQFNSFTGGVGSGADGADGEDVNGDGIPDIGNVDFGSAASLTLGAGAWNGMNLNAGGVGVTGPNGGGVNLDVSHNAHHNAMHLSQNDMQNLFMNGGQSAAVREQLQQQMNMPGGPGGVFVDGNAGSGASQFITAQQMQAAFAAADAATAAGDTNVNVDQFLKGAGVDLPAASFSGLSMSPLEATSIAGGAGGGNGFVPPGSDPTMSRASMDPTAIASAGMVPLTSGGGNGVVPPDVVAAQRQATLDKISNEVNSSISTIQAQQQQQAQAQAQQQQQQQQQQQAQQQQYAQAALQGQGPVAGFTAGGGDPNLNAGINAGGDPMKQALSGMVDQYRTAVPDTQMTGGASVPVNVGSLDTSSIAYSATSAITANGAGVTSIPANIDTSQGGAQVRDPGVVAPQGQQTPAGGGFLAQASAGAGETAGAYLSRTVGEQWNGKDGFENRMVQASVDQQALARASTNDALTSGNTLQGAMTGQVGSGAVVQQSGGTGDYVAASPASAATYYASASPTGGQVTPTGGQADPGAGQQPMNPLAKESMDKLAQTFQGFVPDVQVGQGSRVETGGLGTPGTGGGYDATSTVQYAQNSAAAALGAANSMPANGQPEQRLPAQQAPTDGGGGGFMASAPKNDVASAGGGTEQFNKSAYLSNQVGEQWRNYDQKLDAAVADQYKQQMNNAVESTYSKAAGPMQDNVTGQASQLPTNMPQAGPQQTYVASNDAPSGGMQYSAPAPQAGSSLARESGPAPQADSNSGGGTFQNAYGYNPGNDEVKNQMDQLAKAVDYTPEVNLARNSTGAAGGGDAGVPQGVPLQGLQYFAQQSYQQMPGQQQMQQLPTNMPMQQQQLGPNANGVANAPVSVPVPMQLRYGNVANNRADALKSTGNARSKESLGGAGGGNGEKGKSNKLSSALGKAASTNAAKKAAAAAAAGSKTMRDPMGSVRTGSTLRRLRQKRQWSQEEILAMRMLAPGEEVMVDVTGTPYIVSVKHVIEIITVIKYVTDPYVAPEYIVEIVEEIAEGEDPYVGRPLPPQQQRRKRFIEVIEIADDQKRIVEIIEDENDPYVAPRTNRAVKRVVEIVQEIDEANDPQLAAKGLRRIKRVVEVVEETELEDGQVPERTTSQVGPTRVTRTKNLWPETASNKLQGVRVLMVIAPERFRDEELAEPKRILQQQGATVVVASTKQGPARGMLGMTVVPECTIDQSASRDYHAIVVVGGTGAQEFLWNNASLHNLLKQFNGEKKIVSSICLGGAVLARAGVIAGRQATVLATPESIQAMRDGNAIYKPEHIVQDSNAITADGPDVSANFAETLVSALERELKNKR